LYGKGVKRASNTQQGSKLTKKIDFFRTSSSLNLPFNMLTRLEVRHVISDDITNVHNFSLLFGVRKIPSKLGLRVKAPHSSLRVFATPEEAANKSYFGDRLDHYCSLLESNRREASELLEAGHFKSKESSSMVIFFLAREPRGNTSARLYG
jgi:hypothetical protein